MTRTVPLKIAYFAIICVFSLALHLPAQSPQEERREFDFWIGEWDVNVRVLQKDNSWKDQHKAVARIYPVLGGKAILELWSEKEEGINGYSLRYYNPNTKTWDLWLNWPGKNQSGTSVLTGSFRHGRGEFFQKREVDAATTQITRYTFSDISSDSLRWDDGYSRDGGKTWLSHWIMEFSRGSAKAPELDAEKNLHTFFKGSTCDLPEFDVIKKLSAGQINTEKFSIYNVLDGCMIIGLVNTGASKVFFTLTYNTFASVYELTFLDDGEDSYLAAFYGPKTAAGFELKKTTVSGEVSEALIEFGETITSINLDYRGKKYSITP